METIEIKPEYSSQPFGQKPNPMVEKAITYLKKKGYGEGSKIADQGCGALRHLKIFVNYYNCIYLVDTDFQINKNREVEGKKTTIKEYVDNLTISNKAIELIASKEFIKVNLGLNAIFNVCTFDVVLAETRKEMLEAARNNLIRGGYFVLIIPRNDSSILCRCRENNKFSDGYFFKHNGIFTFYKNFREQGGLIDTASKFNFKVVEDLSIYRHICLLFTIK